VQIKADVVMADEKEMGERAHLNFGHTFGHAIEATAGYATHTYHHGEAVSLGMIAATHLAAATGRVPGAILDRLVRLLSRIGLSVRGRLAPAEQLIESMRLDKKVADGKIRLVLPDRLGSVTIVDDTPMKVIEKAWDAIKE
jgi:3-dehydroquinate synthase